MVSTIPMSNDPAETKYYLLRQTKVLTLAPMSRIRVLTTIRMSRVLSTDYCVVHVGANSMVNAT